MAVMQATMMAGSPSGRTAPPFGPARGCPKPWGVAAEGSVAGGMMDWILGGALNLKSVLKGCSTSTSSPEACCALSCELCSTTTFLLDGAVKFSLP